MDDGKENLVVSSVLILVSSYRDYTELFCAFTTAKWKRLRVLTNNKNVVKVYSKCRIN